MRKTCCLALLLFALPVHAAQHAVALDAQRYSVSGGRDVRAATCVLVGAGARGDASLALSRLDDSVDGTAWLIGAGFGARIAPATLVRGGVSRIVRDRALDAWSARVGPEFHAGRTSVGLTALFGRREDGAWTNGAQLELEQALSARVALRLAGSLARTGNEPDAAACAVGARWNALGPLHLTGEIGLARDPIGVPAGIMPVLPTAERSTAPQLSSRLGLRIVLP